ncbi:hypothetical protein N658DRAFT_205702 [Parathielavia hyrcaniae]|uniref:Uncharacterized protein n=1 Tax=Parathielavia hyrcaniae TaxID=113614 RepID=A0AAN6Q0P8_9PEZI|nr:hypothetical protein N658DRAFT_205702 [Parathielavia hyrcaniae]
MAPHADETHPGPNNGRQTTSQDNSNNSYSHSDRNVPKPGEYIQFESLPAGGPLNRWSQVLTRGHDFPGAQRRENEKDKAGSFPAWALCPALGPEASAESFNIAILAPLELARTGQHCQAILCAQWCST